jgi:EAL domain-containing protein (putative c-di-GMP-specific phosphodiesterase class I)
LKFFAYDIGGFMHLNSGINKLISNPTEDLLKVKFNPIVSLKRKRVIGVEAEFEVIIKDQVYKFDDLRNLVNKSDKMLDLMFLCYKKALMEFKDFCYKNKEFGHIVLFLTFEASFIRADYSKLSGLFGVSRDLGIQYNRVAIQISEYSLSNIEELKEFTRKIRSKGLIIGFDEICSNCSNVEILAIVEPDILKINFARFKDIQKEFHKIGIMRAMSNLSKTLGALMCCKNIDTNSEALIAVDTGVDLLQGKYFYDINTDGELKKEKIDTKINMLEKDLKGYLDCKLNSSNNLLSQFNLIASKIAYELSLTTFDEYEKIIRQLLKLNQFIECIYVLDKNGIKILETIFAKGKRAKNRKSIFKSSHIGSDHSSREYYYKLIRSGSGLFISEPYISCASGNLCITVSTIFMDKNADKFILCIDFDSDKNDYYLSCFS